jgi:flagellar hook-basal body complex protein FliE
MTVSAITSAISSIAERGQLGVQPGKALGESFSALIEAAGSHAIGAIQGAETQSLAALAGQGSTRDVVDAVMSAEQSLRIASGVRDKIISAYLDLTRMAI